MEDNSRVRVALRIRPLNAHELHLGAASVVGASGPTVTLVDPIALEVAASSADGAGGSAPTALDLPRRTFTFDHVYHGKGLGICGGPPTASPHPAAPADPGSSAQQARIYEDIGARVLEHAWEGWNASVLAYGQTGSGKSFTMLGGGSDSGQQGLIPRLCNALFQRVEAARAREGRGEEGGTALAYSATVSFCEVYCERVRDLLDAESAAWTGEGSGPAAGIAADAPHSAAAARPLGRGVARKRALVGGGKPGGSSGNGGGGARGGGVSPEPHPSHGGAFGGGSSGSPDGASPRGGGGAGGGHLRVREHPTKGVFVEGLREIVVHSYDDVERLLSAGSQQRAVAGTRMNAQSSRSHALFCVKFRVTKVDAHTGVPLGEKTSKIVLVDLAGSERGDALHSGPGMSGSVGGVAQGAAALATQQHGGGGIGGGGGALSPRNAVEAAAAAAAQRSREMSKINTSLSALGAVIKALAAATSGAKAAAAGGGGGGWHHPHTLPPLTTFLIGIQCLRGC